MEQIELFIARMGDNLPSQILLIGMLLGGLIGFTVGRYLKPGEWRRRQVNG